MADTGSAQPIGQQRHKKGGGNGDEELADPAAAKNPGYKPDQQTADTGAQGIQSAAAKEQAEAKSPQKIAQSHDGRTVGPAVCQRIIQLPLGLLGRRRVPAERAAQGA